MISQSHDFILQSQTSLLRNLNDVVLLRKFSRIRKKRWSLYAVSLDGGVRVKVKQKNRSFLQSMGKKNRYILTERARQMDDDDWFYSVVYAEDSCHS